jgi:hypothetical protein
MEQALQYKIHLPSRTSFKSNMEAIYKDCPIRIGMITQIKKFYFSFKQSWRRTIMKDLFWLSEKSSMYYLKKQIIQRMNG